MVGDCGIGRHGGCTGGVQVNLVAYTRNDGHTFAFWFDDGDAHCVMEQCRMFIADPQVEFTHRDMEVIRDGVIDRLLANEVDDDSDVQQPCDSRAGRFVR